MSFTFAIDSCIIFEKQLKFVFLMDVVSSIFKYVVSQVFTLTFLEKVLNMLDKSNAI